MDIDSSDTTKPVRCVHQPVQQVRACCFAAAFFFFFSAHAVEPTDIDKQIARLGRELTPMGANPKGNANGSIPPFTGTILGAPASVRYQGTGTFYPSAYANEKPLFTITAKNYRDHIMHLTEGQVALFETYPDTFRMPIYPSKRDTRYSDFIYKNVKLNAASAKLVESGNGVTGSFGAVPFPFPTNGPELIPMAKHNCGHDRKTVTLNCLMKKSRVKNFPA
jgi:hypothetical protein